MLLAGVIAQLLSVICERAWRAGEVPKVWREASVIAVFRKGRKGELGKLRTSPGKVIERLILEAISKHVEEKKVLGSGVYGCSGCYVP